MSAFPGSRLRLLLVGCGNMGAAIGAAAERALQQAEIVAVDPAPERAEALLPRGTSIRVVPKLSDLPDRSYSHVVVATKPQQVASVLCDLAVPCPDATVISIAAGITIAGMREAAGPRMRLVRVMPNLPAMVLAGMSVGICEPGAEDAQTRAFVSTLFEAIGRFRWLDREADIDLATALAGSGPGYVFSIVEHLARAGTAIGLDPETAAELARQTVVGAGRMLAEDPRPASELKRAVTSPGGTTQAGLGELEAHDAMPRVLERTLHAAAARSRDLARPS